MHKTVGYILFCWGHIHINFFIDLRDSYTNFPQVCITDAIMNFSTDTRDFSSVSREIHDDVMTWKRFPFYWPFVRGISRSPVDSPHKGPITRALKFIWWYPNQTADETVEL